MTLTETITAYKKYLKLLETETESKIIEYYQRFEAFIGKEHDLPKELEVMLYLGSICHTVEELKRRKVGLKEYRNLSLRWLSSANETAWELIKKLSQLKTSEEVNGEEDYSDQHKVLEAKLLNLINSLEDTAQKLFLYQCHKEAKDGELLYTSSLELERKLLKASTEELVKLEQEGKALVCETKQPSTFDNPSTFDKQLEVLQQCFNNSKQTEQTVENTKPQPLNQADAMSEEEAQNEFEALRNTYFKLIEEKANVATFTEFQAFVAELTADATLQHPKIAKRLKNVINCKFEKMKARMV